MEQKARTSNIASVQIGSEISDRALANHQMMTEEEDEDDDEEEKIIIWLPPTSTRTIFSSASHLKIPQAKKIANYKCWTNRDIYIYTEFFLSLSLPRPGVYQFIFFPGVIDMSPISWVFSLLKGEKYSYVFTQLSDK